MEPGSTAKTPQSGTTGVSPAAAPQFSDEVKRFARAFANNHLEHVGGADADTLVTGTPNWHFFTRDAETAIGLIDPSFIEGAKVSIDVSTGDDDAGNRVFGRVTGWQPEDADVSGKPLGIRLLCEYESDNFGMRGNDEAPLRTDTTSGS